MAGGIYRRGVVSYFISIESTNVSLKDQYSKLRFTISFLDQLDQSIGHQDGQGLSSVVGNKGV